MGASNFPGLAFAKEPHSALVRDAERKSRRSKDERESDKVRERSGGRCEIDVIGEGRCRRRLQHVHHMIGGRLRGRGVSALADHKQGACEMCHRGITGGVGGKTLIREGQPLPWRTDRYRRVK